MMEHQEQQLEEERLAHVIDEIDTQLTQSRDQIARRESEMVAVQRDVFEDGARSGGSLSSADGFESLIELNQSMVTLTNMAVTQDNLAKKSAVWKPCAPLLILAVSTFSSTATNSQNLFTSAVQRCLKKTLQKAWFTTGGHQSPVYSTVFSLGLLIIWHQSAALMAM